MKSKRNRAKRRKEREADEESRAPRINPETKKSILAIIFFGVALLLILSVFGKVGPAGDWLYRSLTALAGLGYYILPAILFLLALAVLTNREKQLTSSMFIGAAVLVLSALGFIEIVRVGTAGSIGRGIGMIQIPFGKPGSLVITSLAILGSLLVMLNANLGFLKALFMPKEKDDDEEENHDVETALKKIDVPTPLTDPIKKEPVEKEEVEEKVYEVNPVKLAATRHGAGVPKKPNIAKPQNYVLPPLSLLSSSIEKPTSGDLRANANIIKRTLESFGINVEMGEINIGPKVTRYTLKPAEGVKISRITALNSDLSLALAAHPIRIEAPIPGKPFVGIEVPNKSAAIVRLGSLITYDMFQNSGYLGYILGRDVSGEPILADIEKMPHLLIAGATGSGKSINIHALLISLLYKNSPDTLRLVLVDPKRVELSMYNGIPHLVAPVITDGKKTITVFRWAIKEMERRYKVLLEAGVRDIKSLYKKTGGTPIPFIVIIVDELADLMAAYGREIESSVVRLAQMARATGIHLIVSTQRPSVEVITGLIKANITSRVALQVASQIDSRTILDTAGAEKLLGGGDMLFVSQEFSKPKRIQGAYIPEEEAQKVIDFIRDNNKEWVAQGGFEEMIPENGTGDVAQDIFESMGNDGSEEDDLYNDALVVVREAKKASASLLQRRLKVGYARAARLLDIMESHGIIGPGEGAKPREVFIGSEDATIGEPQVETEEPEAGEEKNHAG